MPLFVFLCVCSQLRAQNQVLKKAVVDEQANSASLKVNHKYHDHCLICLESVNHTVNLRDRQEKNLLLVLFIYLFYLL